MMVYREYAFAVLRELRNLGTLSVTSFEERPNDAVRTTSGMGLQDLVNFVAGSSFNSTQYKICDYS